MKNVYAANIYVSYSYKTKILLWEKEYQDSFSFQENGNLIFVDEKDAESKFKSLPYIQRLLKDNIDEYFYFVHGLPRSAHIESIKIVPIKFITTLEYLRTHMVAENFLEYCAETQKKFLDY